MFLETHTGDYTSVHRKDFRLMTRTELQDHLELRGFAVYDDEPLSLLVETAEEDYDNELPY